MYSIISFFCDLFFASQENKNYFKKNESNIEKFAGKTNFLLNQNENGTQNAVTIYLQDTYIIKTRFEKEEKKIVVAL